MDGNIIALAHDDERLIRIIGYLLGSEEWFLSHDRIHLYRRPGKVFFLLITDEEELISIGSVYNNIYLGDAYTVPEYRRTGCYRKIFATRILWCSQRAVLATNKVAVLKLCAEYGFSEGRARGQYRRFMLEGKSLQRGKEYAKYQIKER